MPFPVADAIVHQVSTPGLGDHSYVVTVGSTAIVIDPQRDIARFESLLDGMTLVGVFETHVHNDYASGGPTLARSHHCGYVLPVGTGATVAHNAIAPGDTVEVGSMTLRAIATPGHTPHHLSYALYSGDESVAVFTGGSMLVGAVGRCDLISPDLTDELVRAQYRSVNQLAADLDDPSLVVPTHGAGSFCSASAVSDTTSTIKLEKGRNPALTCPDEDTFAAVQLAGYQLYPSYYSEMGPLNAAGAPPMPSLDRPHLSPMQLAALGTPALIDVRPATTYAEGHLIGSINVPYSDEVATYVGWLVPIETPIVLIADDVEQCRDVTLQLGRIGFDNVAGFVPDGLAAWRDADLPLATSRVATFGDLFDEDPSTVLDVRDPVEFADGSLPGALNVHVGNLGERMADIPEGEVWVHCASGYRASAAVGLLERAGRSPVLVKDNFGGVDRTKLVESVPAR